jgi:hypothetical protein
MFLTDFFASAASLSRPSFSCSHIISGHSLLYGTPLPLWASSFFCWFAPLVSAIALASTRIINGVASTRHLPRHASACTVSGTRKYVAPPICNASSTSIGAPVERNHSGAPDHPTPYHTTPKRAEWLRIHTGSTTGKSYIYI